jgi:hypothetical protein
MTDITRKRGDTYADQWVIKDTATGQALDITGCTFILTVDSRKEPADESTKQYSLTGSIVGAPTAGRVEFAPSPTQADRVGAYYFDMQMTDAAGRKRTLDAGKYRYTQDITKG